MGGWCGPRTGSLILMACYRFSKSSYPLLCAVPSLPALHIYSCFFQHSRSTATYPQYQWTDIDSAFRLSGRWNPKMVHLRPIASCSKRATSKETVSHRRIDCPDCGRSHAIGGGRKIHYAHQQPCLLVRSRALLVSAAERCCHDNSNHDVSPLLRIVTFPAVDLSDCHWPHGCRELFHGESIAIWHLFDLLFPAARRLYCKRSHHVPVGDTIPHHSHQ